MIAVILPLIRASGIVAGSLEYASQMVGASRSKPPARPSRSPALVLRGRTQAFLPLTVATGRSTLGRLGRRPAHQARIDVGITREPPRPGNQRVSRGQRDQVAVRKLKRGVGAKPAIGGAKERGRDCRGGPCSWRWNKTIYQPLLRHSSPLQNLPACT